MTAFCRFWVCRRYCETGWLGIVSQMPIPPVLPVFPDLGFVRVFDAGDGDRRRPYFPGDGPRQRRVRNVCLSGDGSDSVFVGEGFESPDDLKQSDGGVGRALDGLRERSGLAVVDGFAELVGSHSFEPLKFWVNTPNNAAYLQHLGGLGWLR